MVKPQVLVLRAPGTNCDEETAFAFEQCGATATRLHVNRLIENPDLAKNFQILCLPGGFSYGDDIAAGRILAVQLKTHLSEMVNHFRGTDRLVLGICNGFQVMMRLGILFDPASSVAQDVTLAWNDQARYEDRWIHTQALGEKCVFLKGIDRMYLPIAHGEGRLVARDSATLDALDSAGQLCLRYCDGASENTSAADFAENWPFPLNPNGSQRNVAGICDASGRIFGLMPHPERHFDATHHPSWTRRLEQPEFGDGRAIFANAVGYFA